MLRFRIRKQRKVHHRLIFDRKGRNNPLTFQERMAVFSTEKFGSVMLNSTNKDVSENEMNEADQGYANEVCRRKINASTDATLGEYQAVKKPQVVWDEKELRWKKKRTPEETEDRRRKIVETLNKRRNAICSELERAWFLEGAHLEKHRHNLQVTHELTIRGLAVWW